MTQENTSPPATNAALVLADGKVFFGQGIGKAGTTGGEICFNTAMTGYQEVLTDPSYAGQIITFTFPHIGNVGTNAEDIEAREPYARGLVLREPISQPSNFRSTGHFDDWLKENNLTGIAGVDTRALTRHIRLNGAQNAAIIFAEEGKALDISTAKNILSKLPEMEGLELARTVATDKEYEWEQAAWKLGHGFGKLKDPKYHVVAIDYGEKLNILRLLAEFGCKVTVVPATATAEAVMVHKPDGVFLSNGPGDPAATAEYAVPTLQKLIEQNIPIFGICLGHQLLALALGAKTEKMRQGHRGANHPVKNLETGTVEITSQNHGFVVSHAGLPKGVVATHTSLFDGTVEGFRSTTTPVFAVQYHPESSPGPHDSRYLFAKFVEMMKEKNYSTESNHDSGKKKA